MPGLAGSRRMTVGRVLRAWCGVGGEATDETDGAANRYSGTVAREVEVQVIVPALPTRVPVVMHYDVADPYAVSAELPATPGREVSWVFARDLMSEGLTAPTGDGDVRIWPAEPGGSVVRIALRSPDGEALVEAAVTDLVDFLHRSYSLCPPGRESDHLDVEGALLLLLAS